MEDQKSVVDFRLASRDVLAYWLADRQDQLAFLTLSGRSYSLHNNGATRVGSELPFLEYAADVSAPTSKRQLRWNGTSEVLVENGATSAVTAADLPTWAMFVKLKAYAKSTYMRAVRGNSGDEVYHAFLTPDAMAHLKLDPDYMANVRSAEKRGKDNPLFTGSAVEIDGIVFHEYRHVYNTTGAASGSKWGAGGAIEGCQILFCGAQALGMADIGAPSWVEKGFDYDNQQGISIGKISGFLKPKFNSIYAGNTVQDFGVISVYVAQ
jgi:N4-gp56 family major capsid protein